MLKTCLFSLLLLPTLHLFSPTKLLLDNTAQSFALSASLSTLVINPVSTLPGLLFYRNNGSTFRLVGRTPRDHSASITPQKTPQISRDGSILVSSYTDNYVRVYRLSEEKSELVQKIDVGSASTESFLSVDGGVLIVGSSTSPMQTSMYQWDARKGIFEYLSNSTMGAVKAISPDGRYIIDCNLTTSSPYVYPYTQITTCQPFLNYLSPLTRTQYVREPLTLQDTPTNYFHFSLAKRDESTYPILVLTQPTPAQTTLPYTLQFFLMKDGKISDLQNVATLPDQPSAITLSASGNSLAYAYDSQIFLYTLHHSRFVLSSQHSQLSPHTSPNALFLSDSANFLAASSYSPVSYPDDPYAMVFFTNCTPPCSHCWPGKCLACAVGFALVGDACLCPEGTHLVAGNCKVCPVAHCSRCASVSQCEVCAGGFQLSEGQCFCGEGRSVSASSGQCIRCEIEGCSHCEVPNVCAESGHLSSEEGEADGETDAGRAEHSELSDHHEKAEKTQESLSEKEAKSDQNPIKEATIELLENADDEDAIIVTLVVSLIVFLLKTCCNCLKNKCMRCLGIKSEEEKEAGAAKTEEKEKGEKGKEGKQGKEGGKLPYLEFTDEKGEELQSESKLEKLRGKNKLKRLEFDETEH